MIRANFIFNQKTTTIECNKNDLMEDIYKQFATKINIDFNKLYFYNIENDGLINYNLPLNEQAKIKDKNPGKMEILVIKKEDKNENKSIIDSKDIICPKCGEICLLDIKGYKIALYDCKIKDKIDNILLEEYEKIQKIDQSKVLCGKCNKSSKSIAKNNEFYKCLGCDINLCQKCKSKHDNNHNIINYEKKIIFVIFIRKYLFHIAKNVK